MLISIDVTEDEIELMKPWLEEFDTSLATNVSDNIVHEVLSRMLTDYFKQKNNLQN